MHRSHFAFGLGLLAVLALQTGSAVAAQVVRCVGEQGEPMFAQSCARPLPAPAVIPARPGAVSRPAPAATDCARTPQGLEAALRAAIRGGNGVRLSGLVLWPGMSMRAARSEMRQLVPLLREGSSEVTLLAAAPADPFAQADTAADAALVVTTVSERKGETRSQERHFGIVRARGCYWLTLRHAIETTPPALVAEPPADAPAFAFRPR